MRFRDGEPSRAKLLRKRVACGTRPHDDGARTAGAVGNSGVLRGAFLRPGPSRSRRPRPSRSRTMETS
ncbi:hypothetical protein MMX123_00681 [Microbacterium sp. MM2322]